MRQISIAVMLLLTCCAGEEPVTGWTIYAPSALPPGAVAVEDEKAAIVRAQALWQLINPDVDVGTASQWLTDAKASLADGVWTINRSGVTLSINRQSGHLVAAPVDSN
jgi:hypothetical protein